MVQTIQTHGLEIDPTDTIVFKTMDKINGLIEQRSREPRPIQEPTRFHLPDIRGIDSLGAHFHKYNIRFEEMRYEELLTVREDMCIRYNVFWTCPNVKGCTGRVEVIGFNRYNRPMYQCSTCGLVFTIEEFLLMGGCGEYRRDIRW